MTNTRVNEIDLLRFFAALSVVLFHYSFRGYAADSMTIMPYLWLTPVSKYGYLGVELFFMISGFVILMTAANGGLRNFVISRVVRLYPAFWACCTITTVVTILIGAPYYSASLKQYFINMTMMSGFLGIKSIDGAYWSLFIEIKFYLLVAVILIIGKINQSQLFLIIWLLTSIILTLFPIGGLCSLLITDYSAYFIAGASFFLIWSKGVSLSRISIIAGSWGLALFKALKSLSNFEAHYQTTMNHYTVAAIITIFFIIMMLVSLRYTGRIKEIRWVLAGALTYPLYLVHQNVGFMIFNQLYPTQINVHLLFWGTIAFAQAVAYLVYILVEKRFAPRLKTALNALTKQS